ncbi:hypothetical protein [Chrysodeixis includens nucleopolyhedrovirus]|uniref:Uncharacterized protein n=1 Tax=Chrysodeixis includens nucleopolyhedrovirus TaxID=1207438 RepID=A0A5B8YRG3_9ABAC|nr:hypothetical protein QKU06_gp111 [Chrysodeixis includens nucleopolyhedrovirus]QED40639.1 hypothetical protein [Chrysodeixis includens nucleopolyhedrovirus]
MHTYNSNSRHYGAHPVAHNNNYLLDKTTKVHMSPAANRFNNLHKQNYILNDWHAMSLAEKTQSVYESCKLSYQHRLDNNRNTTHDFSCEDILKISRQPASVSSRLLACNVNTATGQQHGVFFENGRKIATDSVDTAVV